jgi:hypothetical protein
LRRKLCDAPADGVRVRSVHALLATSSGDLFTDLLNRALLFVQIALLNHFSDYAFGVRV